MDGYINRGGKKVLPSFEFRETQGYTNDAICAQMLESIRGILQSIDRKLSRLDCSETLEIPRSLRKIEKNTRKTKRKKTVK